MSLKKYFRLTDSFSLELDISKEKFIKLMKEELYEYKPGFFDIHSSGENEHIGKIENDLLEIKRRPGFLMGKRFMPAATGKFFQKNDKVVLNLEIKYSPTILKFFYLFYTLTAIFIILLPIINPFFRRLFPVSPYITILVVLLQCLFGFAYSISTLKKSIALLKEDITKDLASLVEENQSE